MKHIQQQFLTGERALYRLSDATVSYTTFADGESPIKECHDLVMDHCLFKWRYPVWYSQHITLTDATMYADARAALWYCEDVSVKDSTIAAPKCVRRCRDVTFSHVHFPNAQETFWHCDGVTLNDVTTHGEYLFMNSENIRICGLDHMGNYPFDGAKHVYIENAKLLTKDAFWNSEDVYVKNSTILGEYLAWNSKNVTFENCVIDSLQGLCYMDNVRLLNCRLVNTSFAFEYSVVDATVKGRIDSVFNPTSGKIVAEEIGTVALDPTCVDPSATEIVADVKESVDHPIW